MDSHNPSFLDLTQPEYEHDHDDRLTRKAIFYRIVAFTCLEGAFLALSTVTLVNPIIIYPPQHITISLSEAKAGFTILFIAWHAIAVMILKDVMLHVFSAECLAQYERTGRFELQKTDRVSKLTTGFIGQARHFLSSSSTIRYRLAMVLILLLMALGGLGPSIVSVSTVAVDHTTDIDIANVTTPLASDPSGELTTNSLVSQTRANSILRLELFENITFGYESSGNLMIPWPPKSFTTSGRSVVYNTDVLSFNFNCTWYKPTVWKRDAGDQSIFWRFWDKIFILRDFSENAFAQLYSWPTGFIGSNFLFASYGQNNSRPGTPFIDFTGLPTTSRADFQSSYEALGQTSPEAVTALVCDPQLHAYTAKVTLDQGVLSATPTNNPPIHNFDDTFLRSLFIAQLIPSLTTSFNDSIFLENSSVNSVAQLLFFCNENTPCEATSNMKPLPIANITSNMNRFLRSASKVILDGYNGTQPGVSALSLPNFNTFVTQAVEQVDQMALVSNRLFFAILVGNLGLIGVSVGALCFVIEPDRLFCFNLDNVSRSLLSELERSPEFSVRSKHVIRLQTKSHS